MKTKRIDLSKSKTFIENLRKILDILPTEDEKNEINNNFEVIIKFLNEVRDYFILLPSKEDMDKPRKAIDNLNHLLISAENNPILSNIFSLKKQTIRRSKSDSVKSFGEEEIVKVKKEIKYLDYLPVEQIRLKLGSENYSVSAFQAIASELGIRFKKKVNKEILVEQITSKIINFRGYRLLSGESENKW